MGLEPLGYILYDPIRVSFDMVILYDVREQCPKWPDTVFSAVEQSLQR